MELIEMRRKLDQEGFKEDVRILKKNIHDLKNKVKGYLMRKGPEEESKTAKEIEEEKARLEKIFLAVSCITTAKAEQAINSLDYKLCEAIMRTNEAEIGE